MVYLKVFAMHFVDEFCAIKKYALLTRKRIFLHVNHRANLAVKFYKRLFRNCISMSVKESAVFKLFPLFNQLFRYL